LLLLVWRLGGVSWTIFRGWPQSMTLPISACQVGRITDISHHHLTQLRHMLLFLFGIYLCYNLYTVFPLWIICWSLTPLRGFFLFLGIGPKASCLLDKHWATSPAPSLWGSKRIETMVGPLESD
jgi:hypothetical protein